MTRDDIIKALDWHAPTVEMGPQSLLRRIEALVAQAEAAEREACAQILDHNADACANNSMLRDVLEGNAAAIRARGNHGQA